MEQKACLKMRPGFRQGKLTVEADSGERKSRYTVWRCRCDCGGEILLDTRCLQRGTVRDCGCETRVKPGQLDLTGRRFGRLTALEPTARRDSGGAILWYCRCECGKEILVSTTQLTQGGKKSCGCLGHPALKRLERKRFGKLVVTAYAGKRAGMHRWHCRCDCGRETEVGQTLLQSDKTKSCGCLQSRSITENLRQHRINGKIHDLQ